MVRRTPAQYDWAKQEFDERLLSKHVTKPRRSKIAFVVVHHSTIVGKGDGKANDTMYGVWQTRQASAHYGVDGDYVMQFVWDRDAAWSTANSTGNHAGISIEHANSSAGPKWTVSEKTWKNGARLAGLLHVTHKLGRPVSGKTLRKHSSFFATACPGPFMDSIWSKYVAEAQRVYDAATSRAPTKPPAEKPITKSTHTVVKGDTLAAIARRSGKTVTDLTAWNDLEDPARISIGQQLRLTPPEPKTVPVTLLYGNLAGYNADTAPGVTRWKANADGFAALVKKRKPAIVATVEESNRKQNKMRPRIDAALGKDYTRLSGGSDGRYTRRRAGSVKALGSWVFSTTHKFRGDDKQMACFAFEASGAKGLLGVFHAEHESGTDKASGKSGDQIRVDQALEFWDHLVLQAKARGIPETNVFLVGDSNSESWVADALTKRGVKVLGRANFVGWDRRSKKPFNLLAGKGSATDVQALGTDFSDHQFIAATLQLVA